MTPAEALRALHKAGQLRSPWLAGMRVILDWRSTGEPIPLRRSDDGVRWIWPSNAETPNSIVDREAEPDLTDPATVGCLLALLREASGRRWVTTDTFGENAVEPRAWSIHDPMDWDWMPGLRAPTEGEAIVAALIALAGAPAHGAPPTSAAPSWVILSIPASTISHPRVSQRTTTASVNRGPAGLPASRTRRSTASCAGVGRRATVGVALAETVRDLLRAGGEL